MTLNRYLACECAGLKAERRRQRQTLATAAHDLKSPLTIISGYLRILQTERLGQLTEEQRYILDSMHISCQRLQHMVSEFLAYGALGEEGSLPSFKTGDLNACLQQVYNAWRPLYESKKVQLDFIGSRRVPPFAFDFSKVQQLICNLVDNALKFTPSGKSVRIEVEPYRWERRCIGNKPKEERRKHDSDAPNSVMITVRDTGPGIAPQYQQEIFDDFYRGHWNETQSGTGLGLGIAQRIARMHGGKIWVESQLGAGSNFCVVLPLRPYWGPSSPSISAAAGHGGKHLHAPAVKPRLAVMRKRITSRGAIG